MGYLLHEPHNVSIPITLKTERSFLSKYNKKNHSVLSNHKQMYIWVFHMTILLGAVAHGHTVQRGNMTMGFHVTPADTADTVRNTFRPFLLSPRGLFAVGFAEITPGKFLLGVACMPKHDAVEIVWTANRHQPVDSRAVFRQSSDGRLELRNSRREVVWETSPAYTSAEVSLSDSGNFMLTDEGKAIWQSFQRPTDTLVQGQNFTVNMSLTADGLHDNRDYNPNHHYAGNNLFKYELRMGPTGIDLRWGPQVYWRREAMQEKALIDAKLGPIYARLEPDGYLAMYQSENSIVDIYPLATYHQNITFRRLRLLPDGNLVGYYWSHVADTWKTDYVAVEDTCQLPAHCGPYASCSAGKCRCLFDGALGACWAPRGGYERFDGNETVVFRQVLGMDLPYVEYAKAVHRASVAECERFCGRNMSCLGAVYYKRSGKCYGIWEEMGSVVEVEDQSKVLLVRVLPKRAPEHRDARIGVVGVVGLVALGVFGVGMCLFCGLTLMRRRRGKREGENEEDEMTIQMSQKLSPLSSSHI